MLALQMALISVKDKPSKRKTKKLQYYTDDGASWRQKGIKHGNTSTNSHSEFSASDVISWIWDVTESPIGTQLGENGTFEIKMKICIETAATYFFLTKYDKIPKWDENETVNMSFELTVIGLCFLIL